MKTKLQLEAIKEVYDMLQKGLTNPLKINNVYKYLNPIQGMELPQRVKIVAINRFMMLNYQDELKELKALETKVIEKPLEESIGTIENKERHSHKENVNTDEFNELQGFLSKEEKEELKAPVAGTTLEIITPDGKKKRTRSPNGTRKARK